MRVRKEGDGGTHQLMLAWREKTKTNTPRVLIIAIKLKTPPFSNQHPSKLPSHPCLVPSPPTRPTPPPPLRSPPNPPTPLCFAAHLWPLQVLDALHQSRHSQLLHRNVPRADAKLVDAPPPEGLVQNEGHGLSGELERIGGDGVRGRKRECKEWAR